MGESPEKKVIILTDELKKLRKGIIAYQKFIRELYGDGIGFPDVKEIDMFMFTYSQEITPVIKSNSDDVSRIVKGVERSVILKYTRLKSRDMNSLIEKYELIEDDVITKIFKNYDYGDIKYYCYRNNIIIDKVIDEFGEIYIERFPEPSEDDIKEFAIKNGWKHLSESKNVNCYQKGTLRLWKIMDGMSPNAYTPQTQWTTMNVYVDGNKNHKKLEGGHKVLEFMETLTYGDGAKAITA